MTRHSVGPGQRAVPGYVRGRGHPSKVLAVRIHDEDTDGSLRPRMPHLDGDLLAIRRPDRWSGRPDGVASRRAGKAWRDVLACGRHEPNATAGLVCDRLSIRRP